MTTETKNTIVKELIENEINILTAVASALEDEIKPLKEAAQTAIRANHETLKDAAVEQLKQKSRELKTIEDKIFQLNVIKEDYTK